MHRELSYQCVHHTAEVTEQLGGFGSSSNSSASSPGYCQCLSNLLSPSCHMVGDGRAHTCVVSSLAVQDGRC